MAGSLNRRAFLGKTLTMSTGAAVGLSLEDQTLLAKLNEKESGPEHKGNRELQRGKIGNLEISRLICGGNLFSGYAHSRNLAYVSALMKHYFTPEKIMDTLELSEQNGINTTIMLCEEYIINVLNRYRNERGGKIQWIAQTHVIVEQEESIKVAVDNGAVGVFIQGQMGDDLVADGRIDYICQLLSLIKSNGLIAGVGSHTLAVPGTLEKEGLEPDFYFKTLNSKGYWSEQPEQIADFMKTVHNPWIAFKVLAAGAVQPRQGFELAFRMGADFLNIGMFDFQIAEDVSTVSELLTQGIQRERPWS